MSTKVIFIIWALCTLFLAQGCTKKDFFIESINTSEKYPVFQEVHMIQDKEYLFRITANGSYIQQFDIESGELIKNFYFAGEDSKTCAFILHSLDSLFVFQKGVGETSIFKYNTTFSGKQIFKNIKNPFNTLLTVYSKPIKLNEGFLFTKINDSDKKEIFTETWASSDSVRELQIFHNPEKVNDRFKPYFKCQSKNSIIFLNHDGAIKIYNKNKEEILHLEREFNVFDSLYSSSENSIEGFHYDMYKNYFYILLKQKKELRLMILTDSFDLHKTIDINSNIFNPKSIVIRSNGLYFETKLDTSYEESLSLGKIHFKKVF